MEYVPSDDEIPPVSEPILREGSMEHLKSRRQKIGDFLRGTLQQAKQLPGQAVGAAEATASLGSALGLMIPSFVSGAIRQEPAGAMLERNMYIPRTESGARHLQGAAEVLKQIPDVGLLPELQPFVGISRGVGQQLQGAARRAGQGIERAGMAAERAIDPLVRAGLERGGITEEMIRAMTEGSRSQIVKQKGGQFIGGDVPENIDRQLKSLRVTTAGGMEPAEALRQMHEQYPEHVLATMEGGGQGARRSIATLEKYSALNNWIDRNLSNYVKKEMGTPEDPVRKLAESGVTHIQERYNEPGLTTVIRRKEAGFPEQGVGQSPEARSWENLSDRSIDDYLAGTIQPQAEYIKDYEKLDKELYALSQQIRNRFANERTERLIRQGETPENAQYIINDFIVNRNTGELARELNDSDLLKQYSTLRARTNYARDLLNTEYAEILRKNPWIEKLDPSTRLYTARTENLQFDHIVDVLRDDLDSGRIRPEQLSKVSVADAVRRTYEFDQEMAKKAEQAQAELANKLLQESPFKAYDNGYTWVKLPDPAESKENMKLVQDIGCQGGWCTQNESNALYYGAHAEGNNLYVLMSPDKRVHAQIHVQSPEKPYDFDALMSNPQTKAQAAQAVREWRQRNPRVNAPLEDEQIYQALREAGIPETPPAISEIKPRANSWQSAMVADQIEKNPDYQPTIQRMLADFVRSTKYPVEYDLQNTGLIKFGSQYMMPDEVESIIRPQINEALNFLETHPRLQSFRDAQKKYEDAQYNKNISATEYHQLENQAGKSISKSVPYAYQELKSILTNPENYVDRNESGFEVIDRILRELDKAKKELGVEEKKASGGLVSNTDRIAAELRANGMDEEAAFNRALRLANELQMAGGGEVKLAGGGRSAGRVLGKAAERAAKTTRGVEYETAQQGPFYRVQTRSPETSGQFYRGIREQVQDPAEVVGGTTGANVPQGLSGDAVKQMMADPSNFVRSAADQYARQYAGGPYELPSIPQSSLAKQSAIGRVFQLAAEDDPVYKKAVFDAYAKRYPKLIERSGAKDYDQLVQAAYLQLAREAEQQFHTLPVKMSFHRHGEGDYASSNQMLRDVYGNKHLYVYQGGDPHPFLNVIDPRTGLNSNEMFRAVHDFYGHAIHGNEFGPKGEEIAWAAHSKMFSPLARLAMTTETRGQNSFVNYTPINAELKRRINKLNELIYEAERAGKTEDVKAIKQMKTEAFKDFQFAPQRSVLLPPEFVDYQYSGGMPKYIQPLVKPESGTTTESELTHFSNVPGLRQTEPSMYGTGIAGEEAKRLAAFQGAVRGRTYFYTGEPGMIRPEPGLGPHRYRAESSQLYDVSEDPLLLRTLAAEANRTPYTSPYNKGLTDPNQAFTDVERMVKEYGYEGLMNPQQQTAIMYRPTPVEPFAKGGEVKMAGGGLRILGKALSKGAAKPVSESEGNLAKFLESSKVQNRAYHATNQDISRFDPTLDPVIVNNPNIAGWFAKDPEFANDFASQSYRYWKTQHKPWEQDPNIPKGVNIMPVHLSMENPFNASNLIKNLSAPVDINEANLVATALNIDVKDLLESIPKTIKYKKSGSEREHMPRGFDLVKSTAATDAMKRLGYDGVIAVENGSEVYAPFRENQIKSAIGNRGTYDIRETDITKRKGGEVKLAGGGRGAGKVLGKAAESATSRAARVAELTSDSGDKALPLRLPRANLPSVVIDAEADRVARQMLGEFVRSEKQGDTTNLAGRSFKEVQRLQELPYTLRETGTIAQETPYTPRVGDIKVSFPGDQTVSNRIVESVGDVPIGTESQGGGKYALGQKHLDEPEFWKSNVDPAMRVQAKVDRLAELYEPERMIGIHTAMGPTSNNFAMHLADATLRAIDWSKVKPRDINTFDQIMVEGARNPQTGERIPFPDWPGLANPEGALEAMKKNSLMRKHFNDRMKTPKITKPLGLPNGLDIQWAITEPDIRNMEISMTGLMAGELKPGALVEAAGAPHDTYSHRILGKAIGQQEVLTPFVISFPDAAQHIMSTKQPAEFTGTIQKIFPHQLVDDQYVNQYNQYRERIKKLTGKKKGGAVKAKGKVSGLSALRK